MKARYADGDELLAALSILPVIACHYGKADEALSSANELYARTVKRYGDHNGYVDDANEMRGQLALLAGRADDSISFHQKALDGYRRHLGAKHPNMVVVQSNLAEAYLLAGRGEDSRQALETAKQWQMRDHADDKRLAEMMARTLARLEQIRAGKPPNCGAH